MFHVEHRRMDYHLHTNHSMDGRQTMPELCETMLARGVQEIALTEHIEPGHPGEGVDVPPVWADWFAEIARCRAAYPEWSSAPPPLVRLLSIAPVLYIQKISL